MESYKTQHVTEKLNALTKLLPCVTVLALFVSPVYPVFAQYSLGDKTDQKILALDNTLVPQIAATLSGLALTGATFLINVERNTDESPVAERIRQTRRSFIKAFFMFLICTIILFVFDFIEIIDERDILLSTILDVTISYGFFGAGAVYLAKAASMLYFVFRK